MSEFFIDSNSLIEFEEKYPKDIFPSLYELCSQMFNEGKLFSVPDAYQELKDSKEYWTEFKSSFRELNFDENELLADILNDSDFKIFVEYGVKEIDGYWADPQLIACAMFNNGIVVSEESTKSNPERKIPYVCEKLDIPCIKLLDFFRKNNVCL